MFLIKLNCAQLVLPFTTTAAVPGVTNFEEMSESTFLAWMHTYSTDGPSSESAVESFEGSEAKIGDGVSVTLTDN